MSKRKVKKSHLQVLFYPAIIIVIALGFVLSFQNCGDIKVERIVLPTTSDLSFVNAVLDPLGDVTISNSVSSNNTLAPNTVRMNIRNPISGRIASVDVTKYADDSISVAAVGKPWMCTDPSMHVDVQLPLNANPSVTEVNCRANIRWYTFYGQSGETTAAGATAIDFNCNNMWKLPPLRTGKQLIKVFSTNPSGASQTALLCSTTGPSVYGASPGIDTINDRLHTWIEIENTAAEKSAAAAKGFSP